MNKASLIESIAQKTGLPMDQVEKTVEVMVDLIIESLKQKEEVTITSFGTFSARVRSARMGVNPQKPTERITIPEVVVPKFKAGKRLKQELKKKEEPPATQTPVAAPIMPTNPQI
ncbi:MAG: nucleoid DNA-binding protein [Parcubacteria group bacterium Gr01-1014_18]|nr:MAG: nucleoid DNA-binding protein [Parcubacteria group bacterium Greene0416_36]TSC81214.1 MAG: nucleoid DNA-binding protein [Parcubacteria group bacterium Gr01-1014_18]TSC99211.1 MAG: nucleoid DNA-binding protein [Parcubacteria group bacterium Greene1014_20]TSD07431.1 MAG: nucleoid DNA-binding protein [Parcubacteria group bacterium Greene0714_2]